VVIDILLNALCKLVEERAWIVKVIIANFGVSSAINLKNALIPASISTILAWHF